MKKLIAALAVAALLTTQGCATLIGTVPSGRSYLGTRADAAAIGDGFVPAFFDLPLTAIGDTLVLPYTLVAKESHMGPYGAWD
jgi:uncharacterized protein YceK